MNADAVPLHKILNFNMQMIIPIFQREYSWEREQVRILWEDILKLYENVYERGTDVTHFLGPIVRVELHTSSVDVDKLWLIDGQQRIITLMVLMACLRNKDPSLKGKIESGYFYNQEEEGDNYYKLIPSEGDRENFKKIIDGEDDLNPGKLKETFDFFNKALDKEKDIDLEKLRGLIIKRLILVNIDVDNDENPYIIFESLNAKGTPLTQADLIRNYIFMRIGDEKKQIKLYNQYWRPMEVLLGKDIESFFWRYALKEGTFVKMKRTYANLKSELETKTKENAERELEKFHEYAHYYKKLIDPATEVEEELKKRFERHNRWEMRTEYPILLNIYKQYSQKRINTSQFCDILDILESFVIRRFFCGYPTNKLNLLFIRIYSRLNPDDWIGSLKKELVNDFPSDNEFIEGIKTYPIYLSGQQKCSLILESLEDFFKHKEPTKFVNLQIEHIMPQAGGESDSLPEAWKDMIGPNYRSIYSKYINTLGNLTLTGYNPELGQKSFTDKKKIYQESHLELNKYFDGIEKWDESEINQRAEFIARNAVKIWKDIRGEVTIDDYG